VIERLAARWGIAPSAVLLEEWQYCSPALEHIADGLMDPWRREAFGRWLDGFNPKGTFGAMLSSLGLSASGSVRTYKKDPRSTAEILAEGTRIMREQGHIK